MPSSLHVKDTALWPTLGQTFADLSRHKILSRETIGAGVAIRSLDRANGMERTGAADYDQRLFGGSVSGNRLDILSAGSIVPRDAMEQTFDARRGMQTMHLNGGYILDTRA